MISTQCKRINLFRRSCYVCHVQQAFHQMSAAWVIRGKQNISSGVCTDVVEPQIKLECASGLTERIQRAVYYRIKLKESIMATSMKVRGLLSESNLRAGLCDKEEHAKMTSLRR